MAGKPERVFLGWDGPLLPAAAAWLLGRFGPDLGAVTVALPGRRAGRRLEELLALAAQGPGGGGAVGSRTFVPARITTAGGLSDVLLRRQRPAARRLARTLLWARALREQHARSPAELARVVAAPPDAAADSAWTSLAEPLRSLHGELGAACLDCADVLAALDAVDDVEARADRPRWQVLVALQQRYRALVAEAGLDDPHDGRRAALERGDVVAPGPVVLPGLTDVGPLLRRALERLEGELVALVFAPSEEADGFDELGCVRASAWAERDVPLRLDQWSVVDRPLDQARCVVEVVRGWRGRFAAAEITVGIPDEDVVPYVEQRLAAAGVAARAATGRPWARSPVGRLMAATTESLRGGRFAALAALARHVALERAIERGRRKGTAAGMVGAGSAGGSETETEAETAAEAEAEAETEAETETETETETASEADRDTDTDTDTPPTPAGGVHLWRPLAERLDRHHARHLPLLAGPAVPGQRRLASLLGALGRGGRRALPEWANPIARYLARVYGERTLDREEPEDAELVAALSAVSDALSELAALPAAAAPAVEAATALDLLLAALAAEMLPPPHDDEAIELLGWLELPFDDAPALIVTGFQEGRVPEAPRSHAFLPEALRAGLGLPADELRLARDVFALTLLIRSRQQLHLVCGRRSAVNDPLHPSRLLFHAPDAELVSRVEHALPVREEAAGAGKAVAAPPRPLPCHPLPPAPTSLSVTDFGAYLRSPYAFYLERLLRLETVDDERRELDAREFGELAHAVLERFGRSELAVLAGGSGADESARNAETCEQARSAESGLQPSSTESDGQASRAEAARPVRSVGSVEAALAEHLAAVVEERFGSTPQPAVRLQVERLRLRLRRFARWQAQHAAEGWRIAAVEWKPEEPGVSFEVDGRPVALRGKIDRIDSHPELGWAIFDYKTSDYGKQPGKTHGPVDGQWKDLQLPLYCVLAAPLAAERGWEDPPRLAYLNLSKEPDAAIEQAATWTPEQLDEALEEARAVVRRIRASDFFVLEDFPTFDEIPKAIAGLGLRERADEDTPAEGEGEEEPA